MSDKPDTSGGSAVDKLTESDIRLLRKLGQTYSEQGKRRSLLGWILSACFAAACIMCSFHFGIYNFERVFLILLGIPVFIGAVQCMTLYRIAYSQHDLVRAIVDWDKVDRILNESQQ